MYKYISEGNLEKKQSYQYSEFIGNHFFEEFEESRELNIEPNDNYNVTEKIKSDTAEKLLLLRNKLEETSDAIESDNKKELDFYNKTFEIRKRLYTKYDNEGKPRLGSDYRDYDAYIIFAQCLVLGYKQTGSLKYLSCLLKLIDTLISEKEHLNISQLSELKKCIELEGKFYKVLKKEILDNAVG